MKNFLRVIKDHLGTFILLEDKVLPKIVDEFEWCTWDAFYLKVHPAGVWEGVKDLVDGGCPPGFVIIDDGWQSICHDEDDPKSGFEGMNRTCAGEQVPCRLIKFQENYKFREYVSLNGESSGMGAFVSDLKERFRSVEQVYVWHALCGYWGGIRPGWEIYTEALRRNLLLFFFIFFSINHHQRSHHHAKIKKMWWFGRMWGGTFLFGRIWRFEIWRNIRIMSRSSPEITQKSGECDD